MAAPLAAATNQRSTFFARQTRALCQLAADAFDGVAIHDGQRIVDADDGFASVFGYDVDGVVGLPVATLMQPAHPGDASLGVRKNGSRFELRVTTSELRGSSANPLTIVGVRELPCSCTLDRADREGRDRELSFGSYELICEHDLDGNILFVNRAAAFALERTAEELCTMNLRDIVVERARAKVDPYLNEVCGESVADGLISVRTRGGRTRIWQYENELFTSGGRTVVRGLARDVTEREEALRKVRQSERRFRTIIENGSDIVGIIDRSGRIQYHSPSAERLLGYTAAELAGRPISDLVHHDDLARTNEFFAWQNQVSAATHTIDFRVRHGDGTWRWLSVVGKTVEHGDEADSIIINARDITDRLLLEAQLEQANRVNGLGTLAATVAHEFNNVLMGIQPFAELMRKPDVSAQTIAKGAHHIVNSLARGKRVAQDILRFTHPAEPSLHPVELADWWTHLAPEMEASLADNIAFSASVPPSLSVNADASQLCQVFSNLISNARDAMPRGGKLRVWARRPCTGESFPFGVVPDAERYIHLGVTDSGAGMSPSVLLHAFDPLFTTKQNGGTGLGLAVAHQVVTGHGGHIFAESAPNEGCTFHVFLPAYDPEPTQIGYGTKTDGRTLIIRRVLIVDDEQSIVDGVAELLRQRGMAVDEASTGRAAIERIRECEPDVAIVDLRLPDMHGIQVAEGLRQIAPGLRIIFASSHGTTEDVPLRAGHTMLLQKPFNSAELQSAMSELEQWSER